MLSKEQLELLKSSMTAKNAAIPANRDIAVLFVTTLDELDAQLRAIADAADVKP